MAGRPSLDARRDLFPQERPWRPPPDPTRQPTPAIPDPQPYTPSAVSIIPQSSSRSGPPIQRRAETLAWRTGRLAQQVGGSPGLTPPAPPPRLRCSAAAQQCRPPGHPGRRPRPTAESPSEPPHQVDPDEVVRHAGRHQAGLASPTSFPRRKCSAPPHRRTAAPPHRCTAAPPHRRTGPGPGPRPGPRPDPAHRSTASPRHPVTASPPRPRAHRTTGAHRTTEPLHRGHHGHHAPRTSRPPRGPCATAATKLCRSETPHRPPRSRRPATGGSQPEHRRYSGSARSSVVHGVDGEVNPVGSVPVAPDRPALISSGRGPRSRSEDPIADSSLLQLYIGVQRSRLVRPVPSVGCNRLRRPARPSNASCPEDAARSTGRRPARRALPTRVRRRTRGSPSCAFRQPPSADIAPSGRRRGRQGCTATRHVSTPAERRRHVSRPTRCRRRRQVQAPPLRVPTRRTHPSTRSTG